MPDRGICLSLFCLLTNGRSLGNSAARLGAGDVRIRGDEPAMTQWRRILAAAGLGLSMVWPAAAAAEPATILVDDDTGVVVAASNADRLWYPASLTKMMTVYLAFEAIESGGLDLKEKLVVSKTAAAQPPTDIGVRAGAKLTVETAIYATILRSANDAAV